MKRAIENAGCRTRLF